MRQKSSGDLFGKILPVLASAEMVEGGFMSPMPDLFEEPPL